MRVYENDLHELNLLVEYGNSYSSDRCGKVFKNTNEKLNEIFNNFDFNDKEVLSVLASGDQAFSAYYLGAKNVDTFDKNWVTYYLFYLKKWYIMFYQDYILSDNNKKLLDCLTMHSDDEEEIQVAKVWEKLLIENNDILGLFFRNMHTWNVPYYDDINKVVNIIKNKHANYHELNLFQEVKFDKKYDVIILSNIFEYVKPNSDVNLVLNKNLNNLLNDGGIVINSILGDKKGIYSEKRDSFSKNFIYTYQPKEQLLLENKPLFYTYQKKYK